MNKRTMIKTILILVGAVLFILGSVYITKLVIRDIQVSRAERVIEQAKEDWAKCEIIMKEAPQRANEARAIINGTGFIKPVEVGVKSPVVLPIE